METNTITTEKDFFESPMQNEIINVLKHHLQSCIGDVLYLQKLVRTPKIGDSIRIKFHDELDMLAFLGIEF